MKTRLQIRKRKMKKRKKKSFSIRLNHPFYCFAQINGKMITRGGPTLLDRFAAILSPYCLSYAACFIN
jgi:hypothetical protein